MKLKKIYIVQLTQGLTTLLFINGITNRINKLTSKQIKAEMIILYGYVLTKPLTISEMEKLQIFKRRR